MWERVSVFIHTLRGMWLTTRAGIKLIKRNRATEHHTPESFKTMAIYVANIPFDYDTVHTSEIVDISFNDIPINDFAPWIQSLCWNNLAYTLQTVIQTTNITDFRYMCSIHIEFSNFISQLSRMHKSIQYNHSTQIYVMQNDMPSRKELI